MKIKYEILFSLTIDFENYSLPLEEDFYFVPTTSTQLLLSNQRLLFKTTGNTALVIGEVITEGAEAGKLLSPLLQDTSLEFNYFTKKTSVKNYYSTYKEYDLENNVFFHSNDITYENGAEKFINVKSQNYAAANEYKIGYFAVKSGDWYCALKPSNGGAPKDVSDTAFWKKLAATDFVNQENLVAKNIVENVEKNAFGFVEIKTKPLVSKGEFLDVNNKPLGTEFKIKLKQNINI